MKRIWKFQLELTGAQEITMPHGAHILHVGYQMDNLCLWALVNPNAFLKDLRIIKIFGTGREAPGAEQGNYIGTVQHNDFVWHIFEG